MDLRPPREPAQALDPQRDAATREHLAAWGVVFDELVLAPSLEAKGERLGYAWRCSRTMS